MNLVQFLVHFLIKVSNPVKDTTEMGNVSFGVRAKKPVYLQNTQAPVKTIIL